MPEELNEWNLDAVTTKRAGLNINFYRIFDPKQGYEPNQVIGRNTKIKKISIRGLFQYRPFALTGRQVAAINNNLTDCWVRYIVFIDKQPVIPGDADLADEILQEESYAVTAFKNLDWSNRFTFLVDDKFKMKPGKWMPVNQATDAINSMGGYTNQTYNMYGLVYDQDFIRSKVLLDNKVEPPVPYAITGTVNQVEEGGFTGVVAFDPERAGSVRIPYDYKGGLGAIPCGDIRINGVGGGEFAPAPLPSAFTWNTGLTPGTINTIPEITWFSGDLEPEGGADIDLGTITGMNYSVDLKLPEVEIQSALRLDLPRYPEPAEPGDPGIHGEITGNLTTNIVGRWTGSSCMKEYFIDTDLLWQKDWETGKITANDIKVCIIVDTPKDTGIIHDVFTAYLSSRIRYNDK